MNNLSALTKALSWLFVKGVSDAGAEKCCLNVIAPATKSALKNCTEERCERNDDCRPLKRLYMPATQRLQSMSTYLNQRRVLELPKRKIHRCKRWRLGNRDR